MKLINKLSLFITFSKLIIAGVFILVLPLIVSKVASEYTDYLLLQQRNKVLSTISTKGSEYYLQGEQSYGSYTMLKDDYISLEPSFVKADTIETSRRVVERDTSNYRVLSYSFTDRGKGYLLEIGKKSATIHQYNKPLQRIAFIVLAGLIFISLLLDILYNAVLLRPLNIIIKKQLVNQRFPFNTRSRSVRTTTSDFKYLDEQLIVLMRQVNEAFEKEREFTANASHELMTPISILKSKIENLLLDEDCSETFQSKLQDMSKTVNRLKRIVSSLLLISRIDNAQYSLDDRVNLAELIAEIADEMTLPLESKKLELQVELPVGTPFINQINKDLIYQCIFNLFHNAIKYNNEEGKVKVYGSFTDLGDFELYIHNTGEAIPEAELPLLFNRFKKLTNASETQGNGLGLAIVKSIVNYHSMTINVSSSQAGTAFILTFPKRLF